ncbi:hypothetical protein A33Q_3416 [Indibacter alkaliphilus LW1]|jgi:hypothetical protein|uniref:Uncharacterized protein n=1 Tax=Indibacter alkaliphilus (strain CCUG 57479 / KCTC 22604 / LW1) TaxID=1189612 RepID=S2DT16_INDAL|nr:hypothetical protein [Indibacter alkaliphilus]EOZ95211.1 hypothetical protein A33Q_3416 [Indibacter alkaliphilus LW1]
MKTVEKIEKEKITELKFSKKEVLENEVEKKRRNFELMRAQALGNLLKNKVNITFETADEKIYQVSTTVWAVGAEYVSLKQNLFIPVNAILEVD